MRRFNNKKLHKLINTTGIATFLCGSGEIAYQCFNTEIDKTGLMIGLGAVATGIAAHLIIHNVEYRENLEKELIYKELEEKRNNKFYRNSLLREQKRLEKLDLYLDSAIYKYPSEIQYTIEDDLLNDELLVEKKLEILDLTDECDISECNSDIEYLMSIDRSIEYLELKKKILREEEASIYQLPKKENKLLLKRKK